MMLLSTSEAPESLFHEVATIFPPMGEEEFHHFVADIRQRGLLEPIWTYQGKIIDGIHRYRACRLIGIEPTYREWNGQGSLVSFVVSLNWQRRHLTSSQKAMIALEIEALLAKEHPVGRPPAEKNGGTISTISGIVHPSAKSRDQAAALVGTNGHYVTDAKRIVVQAPELRTSVKTGELTIPEARTLAQLPTEQRVEARSLLAAGTVRTAKAAVLEIKKAAIDAQAQAAPAKPSLALRSWEAWLPEQPPCDLLLTDPPYSTEVEDIEAFAHAWLPLAIAKVKPTGRAYVFIGAYPQEMRAYLNVQTCWPVQQILVWEYKNTLGPKPSWGYKQNWQAILSFSGPDTPPLDCPLLTEQFSVQEINAPDGRLGNRYHTWQKPEVLAEQLIRHSTKPGDLVYDVFSGTGTFVLAAQRLGRIGLGCDSSEAMLTIAERRGCRIAR